jgi:large subunit ribosomal protein L19
MADEVEKKETEQADEVTQETAADESKVEEAAVEEASTEAEPVEPEPEPEPDEAEPKAKPSKETLKKKKVAKVNKVELFNKKYLRDDIPEFKAGDTVRVHYRIVEGDKTRIQAYEGVVIARKHGGVNETFKVRKMSGQIGVERTFFLHSRRIEKIEVKKIGKVRRAKIYYLRGKVGKQARIREAGIH